MNTRYYSNKQETSVSKCLDIKKTPNSGAGYFKKGDLQDVDTLYECKTSVTVKNSYSIKKETLQLAQKQAFENNKLYSVLVFNFGPNTDNYYVLSEKHYKELLNNIRGEENAKSSTI